MTLPYARPVEATPVDMAAWWALQQFLAQEAVLLDERRFPEWLDLLDPDIRYYAPTRYNRLPREQPREWGGPHDAAHFDDDLAMLRTRARRLQSEKAWSEDPPSRTRHIVANIRAVQTGDGAYAVDSDFFVYRGRADDDEEWFVGTRHDHILRAAGPAAFRLRSRTILFDHTTMLANNLGIFF